MQEPVPRSNNQPNKLSSEPFTGRELRENLKKKKEKKENGAGIRKGKPVVDSARSSVTPRRRCGLGLLLLKVKD